MMISKNVIFSQRLTLLRLDPLHDLGPIFREVHDQSYQFYPWDFWNKNKHKDRKEIQ